MAMHMPGGFVLGELIGHGGTAEVWRAAHRGRPIAVKVLTAERARNPRYHRLFRNEVRATAGLSHPGILTVLEHGEMLPPDPRAGCPWLAMELADGGSLRTRCGKQDWATCRDQLLQLLSALAHAHARGIIHRDIKPSNALFVDGVLKLSDFGLAWSGVEETSSVVGTPAYMAPEQFEGHSQEFGPWTDLYAVGCLAWELVCGAPPFVADRAGLLAAAHISWPTPALRPAVPIPAGLASWLAGLLEKAPADRFQRAADAAWALSRLGPPVSAVFPVQYAADAETTLTTEIVLPAPLPALAQRTPPAEHALPPMRQSWQDPASATPPALPGAGMSLYGLRTIPLCGRITERDHLWAALRTVHRTREPGLVILEGGAGTGKSRLAEWLCVTAHASGAADWVHAVHSPAGGRAEGLLAMLLRATGCAMLSPLDARDRLIETLRGALRPDDLAALLDLLTGTNTPTSAAERLALLTRWVAHAARNRPLILWLDDVAWGADALTLTERLLEQLDLPVLLLLTAATPELAERPIERAHLAALAKRPGTLRLSVGPLPSAAHARLIQHILGLDPTLAATLQAHTAGNPLFAVQLVGDWVAGGALVEGPAGLRLVEGGPLLPADLQAVWSHRLARLLDGRPSDDTRALELAAVLGDRVDAREWRTVCLRAGCSPTPDLIEALLEERLVTSTDPLLGFAFVHRLLRQSLLEDLHMSGRWAIHHRDCAEALLDPERRGRHRLEAGEPQAAIPDLLDTADRALALGEVRRAQVALADWH
ncbi:MAG: protein kinase, partial [Myxococcota bacterium]|nr:protein kinase [Myxococcota bacterium]